MCGIIGIVSRPFDPRVDEVPAPAQLLQILDRAVAAGEAGDLRAATESAEAVDRLLRGLRGTLAMVGAHELSVAIEARLDRLDASVDACEAALESDGALA